MKATDVLGIIFSSTHDRELGGLTASRTMGSLPFGGRYRMIDFPLSSMVNSGISKVAVIARSNYQSLMDHIESGKTWDLARKHGGITLFPPFGMGNLATHKTRVESLFGIKGYLANSKEKYAVVCDCDFVANIDVADMIDRHIAKRADITFGVFRKTDPIKNGEYMFLTCENDRVSRMSISPSAITDGMLFCPGVFVISRETLLELVINAIENNQCNLYRDVFGNNIDRLKMVTYELGEPLLFIGNVADYVRANSALFDSDIRNKLFDPNRPVYTKIHDEMPVKYGLGSDVKNCLIADGCEIEGEIENSILFRGVRIGKGAKVKNCILMQSTEVSDNCDLEYVLSDKNAVISEGTVLKGAEFNPFFIEKNAKV